MTGVQTCALPISGVEEPLSQALFKSKIEEYRKRLAGARPDQREPIEEEIAALEAWLRTEYLPERLAGSPASEPSQTFPIACSWTYMRRFPSLERYGAMSGPLPLVTCTGCPPEAGTIQRF